MVVLSWGSAVEVGSTRVPMPAGWIYGVFPPFHLIRVPARFNLFAASCAAVPAAAGAAVLFRSIRTAQARAVLGLGLGLGLIIDLAMVPFGTAAIPPIPSCYAALRAGGSIANLIDAPMFGSAEGQVFSSLWAYWQSDHGMGTTAGYPGLPNARFEAEVVRASPWWAGRLADPGYLADPTRVDFGPVVGVDARDYAWLFLTAHRFDAVVAHRGLYSDARYAAGLSRIDALIFGSRTSEDADTDVFERSRLVRPTHPTWLVAEGWRPAPAGASGWRSGVLPRARVVAYLPDPGGRVVLELAGCSAYGRSRSVRLVEGGRELARWAVEPGRPRLLASPPLDLAAGLHEWSIESDGADRPERRPDRLDDARTPYSLRVDAIRIRVAP